MWLYEANEILDEQVEGYFGFVYEIENLVNGKKYIGKKLFTKAKTRTLKRRKNKIRERVQSDWKEYFGSSKELLEDVTKFGKENFKRTILRLCKTKGETSYYEMWYQVTNNVLFDDTYYNNWIMARVHRSHVRRKENTK